MRRRALFCAGYLLAACIAAASVAACRGVGDALRMYGYTEIRPPSRLFEPGSLVWVEGTNPFRAGIVCTPQKVLGKNFRAAQSRTMDGQLAKATSRGVKLRADLAVLASAGVDVGAVKSVTMTLKNARLVEITDYDVHTRRYVGDQLCSFMADRRRKAGYAVTMIQSALQADVTYGVRWTKEAAADANIRAAALQGLAVGLGLDGNVSANESLSATGLYWGVRDSVYLAELLQPGKMKQISRESRLLSIAQMPATLPTVDADVPLAPIPETHEPTPEAHTDEEWQALDANRSYGPPPGKGRAASWHKEAFVPATNDADDEGEPDQPAPDGGNEADNPNDPLNSWEPSDNEGVSRPESGVLLPIERGIPGARANPNRKTTHQR